MGKRTALTFAFQMSSDKQDKTNGLCAETCTSPNQSDAALLKEVLEKLTDSSAFIITTGCQFNISYIYKASVFPGFALGCFGKDHFPMLAASSSAVMVEYTFLMV